jgi:hypothetical protein
MNEEDYEKLFPLLNIDNYKEYEQDCKFFFNDPKECLAYIQRKKQKFENDIEFAYRQCRNDLTTSCCKKNAGTNDDAYEYCIQKIPKKTNYLFYIIIFFILIIVCFSIINVFSKS